MLKKIIGAAVGAKLAKNSPAVGGAAGVAMGAAVPFVLSRISIPGMIAFAAGGYVAKRYLEKRDAARRAQPVPTKPIPVAAQGDF